jgi:menaquinol-cytochrome c reductase iron-sulfur subunit
MNQLKDKAVRTLTGATDKGREQRVGYSPTRRFFLEVASVGMVGAALTVVAVPIVTVLISPQIKMPSGVWRDVGALSHFQIGQTVLVTFEDAAQLPWAGIGQKNAAWLRRLSSTEFHALSIYCQHLGCPVRWEPGAQLFMCPCHGGVYYADGTVAAGPPPRPLRSYLTRVDRGQVQIYAGEIPTTY